MDKKKALMMVGGFTAMGFLWGAFMAGCVLHRSSGGSCCLLGNTRERLRGAWQQLRGCSEKQQNAA